MKAETMQVDLTVSELEPTRSKNGTRRRRTGKKRLKFQPPHEFPRGVRELWISATREEQERAHKVCTLILSLWLGKKQREEVSAELAIPPPRVWQLSQQALAGMLSGLLHQPRPRRASQETTMENEEEDPRELKKQVAALERKLADKEALLQLLIALPKPKCEPPASGASVEKTKTRAHRARSVGEGSGGNVLEHPLPASR